MTLKQLQKLCHKIAVEKGFWGDICSCKSPELGIGFNNKYAPFCQRCFKRTIKLRNNAEMIALMHSELSEALEELRKENCDMKNVGEELADCIIRILDFCEGRGIDLQKLLEKKIKKNKKRPYKHGKKF